MKLIATDLPGVMIVEPRHFGDERGFFLETFQDTRYRDAGLPLRFVQDNHSRSRRGVLRGLHYQITQPQGKLVHVTRGSVFDVAVDVRHGSPTFGRWVGVTLDDIDHRQLYVPPGFAHGFCVLSEEADFVYKCTDYYSPGAERGIAWNDSQVGIQWPIIEGGVTLSDKDQRNPTLANQPDLPEY